MKHHSEFKKWLETAQPGDDCVYHYGAHLGGCRGLLLDAVRLAYNQGRVDLVQRRSDGVFEYLAIARAVPAKVQFPFVLDA